MTSRQARRIYRPLSDEDRAKYDRMRELLEVEKPEIIARGRKLKRAHDAANAALRDVFELLKAERERQGLSLTDIEERTGITRSALSRLENGLSNNPTVTTLNRYADALGKRLVISLANNSAAAG